MTFFFKGDLYNREISFLILEKIRDEKRFESLEKLKIQLDRTNSCKN